MNERQPEATPAKEDTDGRDRKTSKTADGNHRESTETVEGEAKDKLGRY